LFSRIPSSGSFVADPNDVIFDGHNGTWYGEQVGKNQAEWDAFTPAAWNAGIDIYKEQYYSANNNRIGTYKLYRRIKKSGNKYFLNAVKKTL
jgi:hypothetical protein